MFCKRFGKGVLPSLHVIDEGALRGFVIVNMRWGGFTMEDYFEAAYSVLANNDEDNSSEPEREEPAALAPEVGEFDLRGYELVRTQFLGTYREAFAIFNIDEVHFSSSCFKKIDEPDESERN